MEKLSRSQRYANLRDNITADREENTTAQDLSQYQNRLNGVEDSFNRINPATQFMQQPVYNAPQEPVYQQPAQPTYTAPQQPVFQQPAQPVYQEPAQPVFQQPAQPVYTAPAQQNDIDALLNSLEQQVNIQAEAIKPEVKPAEELSLDDFLSSLDFGTPVQPEAPAQPVYNAPQQPAYQQLAQPMNNAGLNDSVDFDSFINQTLTEVDDYNKEKGLATMDQISQNIITEIQNEAPSQQQVFTPQNDAPLYSAPVIEPVQVTAAPVDQPVQEQTYSEPVQNSFIDDFLSKEEPSMEHPVAYQTLEENKDTEPVEIVNLAELEKTESLTKTVTFAPVEEETETDIDTPNKVLNVLLVVLIVALFLVLGFVVYELISANII